MEYFMKLIMENYSSYLFIVRLLVASTHEPYNLKRIIDSIDSSALNLNASVYDVSKQFTLSEITELIDSSYKLLSLARNNKFDSLFTLMNGYNFLFCEIKRVIHSSNCIP